MKKRLFLTIIMCVIACLVLSGCQSEEIKETEQENSNTATEAKTNTETNKTTNNTSKNTSTNNTSNDKAKDNDKLKPTEVVKKYKEDLALGLEVNFPVVNGKEVVVNVQTSGSSELQKNGPYYIWYEIHIGQNNAAHDKYQLVKEGIHHLEGYGIEMLKTYDMEEDIGHNNYFFDWDLTASSYKGTDKEYVAVSFPAGTEDKNQATLLLATDEGDLIGEFTADVVHDITLTGTNAEKYKNYSGDVVFNSIKDGKVTYLVPSDKMYKTDAKGNKTLDASLTTLELDEYAVTINKDKATSKKTGEIYKITNAKGKKFSFGEFRH